MDPAPARVVRRTLRDHAEASLRELIVGGRLEPGTRVNEVQLAAELGISRGPLREAIQTLAREGLLEVIQHRGAFVRAVDERSLRDLYELRIALETHAVRLVGRSRDPAVLQRIVDLVVEAEGALDEDGGYPNDADFHRGLLAATGNESLVAAGEDVVRRISVARARSARDPERARAALVEHRAVLDALRDGDPARGAELMEEHLWRSYDNALLALAARA